MLQRVQLLLEKETKQELDKLAAQENRSVSDIVREMLTETIKQKKTKKKKSGVATLRELAKHGFKGPGDSEYDKYAYDL